MPGDVWIDDSMIFSDLMQSMADAVCRGDGVGAADFFTPDGVYHDIFYGAFEGRVRIAEMIQDYFHRDGQDFRWNMQSPISDGSVGYAPYVFSYTSKLTGTKGRRAMFEGVSMVRLRNGLIAEYREIANTGPGLKMLGFHPDRILKRLDREASDLSQRPEAAQHLIS